MLESNFIPVYIGHRFRVRDKSVDRALSRQLGICDSSGERVGKEKKNASSGKPSDN